MHQLVEFVLFTAQEVVHCKITIILTTEFGINYNNDAVYCVKYCVDSEAARIVMMSQRITLVLSSLKQLS